jgi:polysaccharide biosynthesis transport protein
MLVKSVRRVNPPAQTVAISRCKNAWWCFLCASAALAMLSAAGRPAKAGGVNPFKEKTSAYLRVALTEPSVTPSNAQYVQFEYELYKNTQKLLLVNPLVLNAALRKPGIIELPIIKNRQDPIEWLSKNLQATFPDNLTIMQVSLLEGTPMERATIVNAVVEAYMGEVAEMERWRRKEHLSELKILQIEKAQEIKDTLNDLRKMAESLGVSDTENLTFRQKNTLDELQAVRREALRGQFELNRMRGELASRKVLLDVAGSAEISDVECQMFGRDDLVLKIIWEEIFARENAAVAKNKNNLAGLQKRYADRLEELRNEIRRKNKADAEKEVKKLEAAVEVAKQQQAVAQEEVKLLRKEADRFGVSSIDMQMRRAAVTNAQKSLDAITAEVEKIHLESKSPPRVMVIQSAEAPEESSREADH